MTAPKPGTDPKKFAAEMPQLRAKLDYADETIFKMTPLVFGTLIDMKPDSQNHASHLIITKDERADLINEIDTLFGQKLYSKDQNYIVSAASVLRAALKKDFRSSDDPWE